MRGRSEKKNMENHTHLNEESLRMTHLSTQGGDLSWSVELPVFWPFFWLKGRFT